MKRETEREKRDRSFWITAFGGTPPQELEPELVVVTRTEDEAIARSPLGRG